MENKLLNKVIVYGGGVVGGLASLCLKKNGFELLFHFARSADSWKDSQMWLQKKDKLLYAISLKIEYVKDEIDLRNQDPHKLNP